MLIEAMRQMAGHGLIRHQPSTPGATHPVCVVCSHNPLDGHADRCPVPSLPRIVAALEAAEQITGDISIHCDFCTGSPLEGHFDDCPIAALVAVLHDEVTA